MGKLGNWIKGTGSYEVKEWSIESGFVDTCEVDRTSEYDTRDCSLSLEDNFYKVTRLSSTCHIFLPFIFASRLGGIYRLSFEYYSPTGHLANFGITIRDSVAGDAGSPIFSENITLFDQWVLFDTTMFLDDLSHVPYEGINLYDNGTLDEDEYFYIRNIRIEALSPLPNFESGTKYLECTANGTIAIPSTQAYGTWEFDFYKGADANRIDVAFINDRKSHATNSNNGYYFVAHSLEVLYLVENNTTANHPIFSTVTDYFDSYTFYRIKITRTKAGVFTVYIKGGSFGNDNWTTVVTDVGDNPDTDTTHTTSKYFVIKFATGDRIANIKIYNDVAQ